MSIVNDVARSLPRINASLKNHQVEHQPSMVEVEGKNLETPVYILIDLGVTLSYISPTILEK